MVQEPLYASRSQPPSSGTDATIPTEACVLHEQMSCLAKQFQTLFDAIPCAGLVRQLSGKPSQGLVISAANVYSGPSTQENLVHVASPGTVVQVFAQKIDQASPPGDVWYRISRRFAPRCYISSGLVINLHQLLQRYFYLAPQLWEAIAADRLEKVAGDDTAYQAEVTALKQQLDCLLELCHNAKQDPRARGNRRWQRRVRLYRRALEAWLRCLGEDPSTMLSDPTACGQILYYSQGCLGLASCNGFDYVLIKSLQWLYLLISLLVPSLLATVFLAKVPLSPQVVAVSLLFLSISVYLVWVSAIGTSLPMMIGYALTGQQALNAPQPGSKASSLRSGPFQPIFRTGVRILRKLLKMRPDLLRYWLRGWGVLGGVVLPSLSFAAIFPEIFPVVQVFDPIGFAIFTFSFIGIAVHLVIVFPFTLTMQAQMCGELIAHPRRPPKARRSAVHPAVKLFSFNTISFLAIAVLVVNSVSAFSPLITPVSSALPPFITPQLFVYLLVVILLYLLCLEFPYRWGLRHWKTCRLGELAALRKRFDLRLSQAPSSPIVEKESSSIQDDYARWQYYRAQEEDVKQTSPGPFSLVQQGWALLIAFASSFLFAFATDLLKTMLKIGH